MENRFLRRYLDMDEIRFFRIRTRELKSLTLKENDVLGVFVPAGTTVRSKHQGSVKYGVDAIMIADRVKVDEDGAIYSTKKREVLVSTGPLTQKGVNPNPKIRKWAQNMRNSGHISVPGELIPVVNDGEVAVPDFNMSGTRWFVVPERELRDSFNVEVYEYTPTEVVKAAPELVWSC